MKIAVLGPRGFPDVQGGVESHCEKLYTRLAKKGSKITVFTRKPYIDPKLKVFQDVNLIPINCPKNKSFEAIIYSFLSVFAARKINPDIVHVHTVGPSIVIPLVRALGMKAVMTHHGPDYQRKKWGTIAKKVLKLGERCGSRWANKIICISKNIADDVKRKYNRDSHIIPNGIEIPRIVESNYTLCKYSLTKGKYIVTVGRFVPEKGFHDLINAFIKTELSGWKLVIIGKADHSDKYSQNIEKEAKKNVNIVLTGFLTGKALEELYSQAGLFILPSYYEGLPIVLLEGMSYGLLCLASDIPANRCVELPEENYFTPGNIEQISNKLQEFINKPLSPEQKSQQIKKLRQNYNWDNIANDTMEIYQNLNNGF